MRDRDLRTIGGLSWHGFVFLLLLASGARDVGAYSAGNGAFVVNGNGNSSHVTMHANGSSTHRRQLQRVGHVKAFEAQLQYYVPLPIRTHPERTKLPVEPLGFALNSSNQQIVMLQYLEHDTHWGTLAQCRGDTCPSMASCGPRFPNLQACWNPNLVEPDTVLLDPPVNCPKSDEKRLRDEQGGGEEGRLATHPYDGFDESCSHKQDFSPRNPIALQLVQLKGVFVTEKGFVLNRTHNFVRPGCGRFREVAFEANQQVHVLPAAFNWGYSQGFNFYHFTVETMPLFLVAVPLLPRITPNIPIIAGMLQWEAYKRFGEPLIGVKFEAVRSLPLVGDDLFFVETLYEPMTQECGNPSQVLWQSLRRSHLLHPQGLPLFRPDWSYRPPPPLTPQQAQALPGDWVVVLARRLSKKRSIRNFEEVEQAVERAFSKERIVVFNGSLTVLEARDLFRRTRLFVAGHGAALTNLVFMPEKASILEIRPDECAVVCYNHLSYACSLTYHLVFSRGGCLDTVEANVTQVERVLRDIKTRFDAEDARRI
ncbi:hypothetical protein CLOM_g22986 [Closterium sp. NIES-68]|nr:hypothetical protein CLOM_g22986 [Closterium sp. NIES-68]GJP73384.1 hypothetical protein CLOP_g4104 [Closterium sp. NIES-67]